MIFPDTHSQMVDKKAWGCMLNYAAKHEWDEVVGLGDLLEGNAVSGHNKGKPKLVEGERLAEDYEYANRLLLDLRLVSGKAKITLLQGNHEWRVGRYIEEHPELDGLINVEQGLKLKQLGIHWVESYPHGKLYNIGKLFFTHGVYSGNNATKKHLEAYGVNIVFGHTHEVGVYAKKNFGKNKTLMAYNLGCLCRYDMPYLEGRPTSWQHAFGTAYVLPNGFFNLTVHNIFNGECVVNGTKYSYRN